MLVVIAALRGAVGGMLVAMGGVVVVLLFDAVAQFADSLRLIAVLVALPLLLWLLVGGAGP